MSDFFEEDEPVAEVVAAFEHGEHLETSAAPSGGDAAYLTLILLRDDERARLSREEVVALEYLIHARLSEVTRARDTADTSFRLALKAAGYLSLLVEELGESDARALVARLAASEIGAMAVERAAAVARSVDEAVA